MAAIHKLSRFAQTRTPASAYAN